MILTGILLALAAGFLWNISGIVNSICAKKKFDLYSYLLANVIFSAIFTGLLSGALKGGFRRDLLPFIAVVMTAGVFNTTGALLLQQALQRGHHGIVFLIAQSAPVIPFIAGMIFLGDSPSFLKIGGVLLIFLGMALAALPELKNKKKSENTKTEKGLFLALLAFCFFGTAHTLLAVPSIMSLPTGAAQFRTFFLYCGSSFLMVAAAGIRCRTGKLPFDRRLILTGLIAAVINVCSMGIFFKAIDFLASGRAVGLGSPVATSASLAGFTLYSWFYLKEKREPAAICGLFCICAGAVAAAL